MVNFSSDVSFQDEPFAGVSGTREEEVMHRFWCGVPALETVRGVTSFEAEEVIVEGSVACS